MNDGKWQSIEQSVWENVAPEKIRLACLISKTKERHYMRLPFAVPEFCVSLTVQYDYRRYEARETAVCRTTEEVAILDLAIEGKNRRYIGSSGSERRRVTISPEGSTPGYRAVELWPGEWNLIIGAYKIPRSGCELTVIIEFEIRAKRFLKGDLHLHSEHSDGRYSVGELAQRARREKLDFLFLTDHNTCSAWPEVSGIPCFYQAVEWTYYSGHFNAYGMPLEAMDFYADSPEEILEHMNELKSQGVYLSLNHPTDVSCPWTLGFAPEQVPYDWMEVWNGPSGNGNLSAIRLWDGLLRRGFRIPALGGSDFHHDAPLRQLASPCAVVQARSASETDLLLALSQGHLSISAASEAAIIWLESPDGPWVQGDIWPEQAKEVKVKVFGARKEDRVCLIGDAAAQLPKDIRISGNGDWDFTWEAAPARYLRAELYREIPGIGELLLCISNPIYWEDRVCV